MGILYYYCTVLLFFFAKTALLPKAVDCLEGGTALTAKVRAQKSPVNTKPIFRLGLRYTPVYSHHCTALLQIKHQNMQYNIAPISRTTSFVSVSLQIIVMVALQELLSVIV